MDTSFYSSDFGGPSYTSAADRGEHPGEESLECIEESKCRSTSRSSDSLAEDAIRRQSSADQTASLSSFPVGELKEGTGRFDFSTVQLAPVLECISGIGYWSLGEIRRRVLSAGSRFGLANRESKRDDEDLQRSLQVSTGFGRRYIRAHHGSDIGRRRELPDLQGGRAYEADAGILEDTQRWDGGGTSWTKAATIGRNHRTRWWRGICWCSTMWSGRQVSDSLIACRPASKQWLLNAVHLEDFVAPWEALDRAADLAWELGFMPHANLSFPVLEFPTPRRLNKKVRFNDLVTLRMTTDKLETTYVIPDGLLSMWHCKPWTLACNTLDVDQSVSEEDETYFMQHSLHVQTHPDANSQCTGPESILSDEVKETMSLYRSTLATCPFVSYGLSETGVGTRTFLLRELSHDGLLLQLREEWMEYSDSNMKVHWVWPQPQGDTPGFHIIVEFLLGDELPHPSIEPTLEETTILSIHGRPDVQRTALYHQRRLHNVDITRPFYDVCHRAQYVCVTRVLGKILPLSWARNIFAGALVQLFAHPPSLQITQEYADYFDRMQPFFADSLAMWAEVHLPTISWQFHLLLPEGYRGVMETTASINSATSVAMVADRAFAHWGMDLPGALVYAGLSTYVSTTQHFIAYDPVEGGIPCLVQAEIDDSLGIPAPPMIAASLSSTCTIQEVIAAINAVWIFDLVGVEITVFDGTLVFDSEDRFRPRHGTSYVVQVRPRAHDEVSTLQILQSMKHASNLRDPRPSRAPDVASGSGGIPQEHTPIPGPTEPEPEGDPPSDDDPDEDPDPEDDDAISDDVSYHPAHVYHLQDDYFRMNIDEITQDTVLEQISDHWQLDYGELTAVHHVEHPPSDHSSETEDVVIAELRQDSDIKPLQTDILSLVDIEFKLPLGSDMSVHWRKVLWLRSTSTREGVLHQLRSFDLCNHRPNFACVLHLNGNYWPQTDNALRHFIHGDYIRLVIICPADVAPRDAAADMREYERAEASRRVFRSDDSSDSTPRSRSPHSRQPTVSVTTEERESPIASEDPPPHVSDLWCGVGSEDAFASSPSTQQPHHGQRPPSLADLVGLNEDGCYWQRIISRTVSSDVQVAQLRASLASLRKWPDTAFCNCWEMIPEAHPYVALIRDLQPSLDYPEAFHLFTDGSFQKDSAVGAWSFSVVLQLQGRHYFRWGFTGGRIECCSSSLEAEALSTAHALLWLVSSMADSCYPIQLHGDATTIGLGADGTQNEPKVKALEELHLRPLFQFCNAVIKDLTFHHVPAHAGQVDNETVDSVAKALVSQDWSPFTGVPDIYPILNTPCFDWAWLLIEHEVHWNYEYPSIDELVAGTGFADWPAKPVQVFPQAAEVRAGTDAVKISLGLLSANVRTLKGMASDPTLSDKIDLLAQQFADANYDIVALQETRCKTSNVASRNGFLRLCAAANSGRGGVELWFNQHGSFASSAFGPVRPEHCHVWFEDSTILGVECDHPLLACDIVVVYAPQSSLSAEVIDDWWSTLHLRLQSRGRKDTILLGDCNAKVGSVESTEIGPIGWSIEDRAGGHLRHLVADHSLLLPSTFGLWHTGPSATFYGPAGGATRLDYIAIPQDWHQGLVSSSVSGVDLLNGSLTTRVWRFEWSSR